MHMQIGLPLFYEQVAKRIANIIDMWGTIRLICPEGYFSHRRELFGPGED